ncbi:ABC-2 family transporter protein [Seinonella peptonophila]|uniref:ABC-2 family transporter protein n=1 Tax=Seinonella peptonophila TaxID=112248 RepID=A0A1M4WMC0_9BACL|nr:ABC transporter permease subunit [Seinonella peptonophila]SHE82451.1 ABC-2 family transporter protein [Seinonella peptonophila]
MSIRMKRFKDWLLNPVLVKELQRRIQSRKTPIILFAYLIVLGVFVFSFFSTFDTQSDHFDADNSIGLFLFLSALQLMTAAFVLPGLTSSMISGEREKQTLYILLTTNLDSKQIVIGKWMASLSFMLMLFICSLPFYVMVYGFGGITTWHLILVVFHLFSTMLFYSSLGIFFSAWIKRTGVATTISYLAVFFHGIGIAVVGYFAFVVGSFFTQNLMHGNQIPLVFELLMAIHPVTSLLDIFHFMGDFDTKIGGYIPFYLFYILFYFITSFALLIAASYMMMPHRFQWRRREEKK